MPSHNHTRGTMNITGTAGVQGNDQFINETSGAFYSVNTGNVDSGTSGANTYLNKVGFDASRSWTGATSNAGGSTPVNILPPYKAVNIWQRIE